MYYIVYIMRGAKKRGRKPKSKPTKEEEDDKEDEDDANDLSDFSFSDLDSDKKGDEDV